MEARWDVFKSDLVKGARFSETYEFPLLNPSRCVPERAIPFEKASKAVDHRQWVHFYTYDRQFECVWRNPKQYLAMFQRFEGIITPDFSLYREMPLAMQIWNTYRNRALAYWMQSHGMDIVPNVSWGDERTYAFAFEGLARGGTVAVSTNGCIQSRTDRHFFGKGLAAMVEALRPETILNYSNTPDDLFAGVRAQGIRVAQIENYIKAVHAKKATAKAVP